MDEDDCFCLLLQTANMIKDKDYHISVQYMKAPIKEHPAVISACVVDVPNKKVGEWIKAFVILKKDARGIKSSPLY